jgi:hypothetical protein
VVNGLTIIDIWIRNPTFSDTLHQPLHVGPAPYNLETAYVVLPLTAKAGCTPCTLQDVCNLQWRMWILLDETCMT